MLIAQDLDSKSTNNLTHPVAQYARVLHYKAHNKVLKKGTSTSFLIADKTHSLQEGLMLTW